MPYPTSESAHGNLFSILGARFGIPRPVQLSRRRGSWQVEDGAKPGVFTSASSFSRVDVSHTKGEDRYVNLLSST